MNKILCLISVLWISACVLTEPESVETPAQPPQAVSPLGNIEWHTSQLADELLINLRPDRSSRIAVATFVPVRELNISQAQHPLMLLGHQLEQGLITEVSRRGWIAQDYKVTGEIELSENGERMFSRQPEALGQWQAAEYFLSGTIVEQQAGAIVNARLIHAKSKDVIASATKFFPAELFWHQEQVTSRAGMLYRTQR